MKSYTDLEQSRKLAEILPQESSDMCWLYVTSQGKHIAMMYEEPDPHYIGRMESYGIKDAAIRCWSLAALLDIIKTYSSRLEIALRADKNYNIFAVSGDFVFRSFDECSEGYNNPIDACVDMIEKLHELKIL